MHWGYFYAFILFYFIKYFRGRGNCILPRNFCNNWCVFELQGASTSMFGCVWARPRPCSAFPCKIIAVGPSLSLPNEIVVWEVLWESSVCGSPHFCPVIYPRRHMLIASNSWARLKDSALWVGDGRAAQRAEILHPADVWLISEAFFLLGGHGKQVGFVAVQLS